MQVIELGLFFKGLSHIRTKALGPAITHGPASALREGSRQTDCNLCGSGHTSSMTIEGGWCRGGRGPADAGPRNSGTPELRNSD